jgi:hypothetical protein
MWLCMHVGKNIRYCGQCGQVESEEYFITLSLVNQAGLTELAFERLAGRLSLSLWR